ncbi:MAG TPA: DUF1415 domain-containing protein [Leucothrix sp.]|nr:DUF1415 domain-containing protein [Leucothrix sp.]
MNIYKQEIITHTQNWISTFIIGHNICPFAKREFDKGSIHYEVVVEKNIENQLQALIQICIQLDTSNAIETSLLIYPQGLSDFDNYLDFLAVANALLEKQNYEGVYQLASFHPDYCFDGENNEDASNYTNRSPYPMLHLIREESLEKALLSYPNPEEIPHRNIQYTRDLGVKILADLLFKSTA